MVFDADKASDAGSGPDSDPGLIGENHLDENITGIGFFLRFDFLTAADNHFALDRDNSGKDLVGEIHGPDTSLESLDGFVLVARVGVDDIPAGVKTSWLVGESKDKLSFFGFGSFRCGSGHGWVAEEVEG